MIADKLLSRLDAALDAELSGELGRPERLALAVWWMVDRLRGEFDCSESEAADQVRMMASLAAEQMRGGGLE